MQTNGDGIVTNGCSGPRDNGRNSLSISSSNKKKSKKSIETTNALASNHGNLKKNSKQILSNTLKAFLKFLKKSLFEFL